MQNLILCFLGVLVGQVVGVLPGIGPVGAIAVLLPLSYYMDPAGAIIMLAGIYYGGMYGGSITSILVNVPGEAASVVTCLDGYPLAKKGRGGVALAITAAASFLAGTGALVLLMFLAPVLAQTALRFGPPEYFAIVLAGLLILSRLTDTSVIRSYLMAGIGVLLSLVGIDAMSGSLRLTFGAPALIDGIDFIPVIIGLYGLGEVLAALDNRESVQRVPAFALRELMPSREEVKRSWPPVVRGGLLGFLLGLIPGPASIISTYSSYSLEKRLSKHPEEFGQGAVEGIAGPEAANNGASMGALVPLLSLGVPFSPLPAVMLSALMIQGITPGPLMMSQHPTVFWGLIVSLYLGNFFLLLLNLPLVGVFVQVASIPARFLMPAVMMLCFLGVYSVNNSLFDVVVLCIFGVLGYVLRRAGMEPSPIALGLILGPILENSFFQSTLMFHGDLWSFFTRPISGTLLTLGILASILPPLVRRLTKGSRREAPQRAV